MAGLALISLFLCIPCNIQDRVASHRVVSGGEVSSSKKISSFHIIKIRIFYNKGKNSRVKYQYRILDYQFLLQILQFENKLVVLS